MRSSTAASSRGRCPSRTSSAGASRARTSGTGSIRRGTAAGSLPRALAEVADDAFGPLGLHRLEAGTLVDNIGSQRVLEKNGFTRIGIAPRYLRIGGAWQDHLLFQRTVEDGS